MFKLCVRRINNQLKNIDKFSIMTATVDLIFEMLYKHKRTE